MNIRVLIALPVLVLLGAAAFPAPKGPPAPPPEKAIESLDTQRPRLLLKDARLRELKNRQASDPLLAKYVKDVRTYAERVLKKKPLKYELRGPRLLHVSRDCLDRVVTLALMYRWSGEEKYARGAVDCMNRVAEFKDWHPSHFLDTAEMTNAVAIGYDWLYDYIDEATRAKMRRAIVDLGLKEGMKVYEKKGGWARGHNNWNQVCNGGMLMGALAVADTDPELAGRIVHEAVVSLPYALASYAPDGAWLEGPGYWHYATRYVAWGFSAMDTALGTDFGLSKMPGIAETGFFPIYACGPTQRPLCFADCGSGARGAYPCQFYLAAKFDNPFLADSEHHFLKTNSAKEEHLIWYTPPSGKDFQPPELDRFFDGKVPVATFRSAWNDPAALWVGAKAGYNEVPHGHLDLGNFELDALGVRWAVDLGGDNYNLPGYWQGKRGGQRWTYYRLNSLSHNVPALNGQIQDPLAHAKVERFESTALGGFVVVDISEAYRPLARRVTRGVRMTAGRRAVLVQDDFALIEPCEVAWGMTTRVRDIEIDGARAILRQHLSRLDMQILEPQGATFAVESAEQAPPQATNEGVRRIVVRYTPENVDTRVAILFTPVPQGAQPDAEKPRIRPIEEWQPDRAEGGLLKSMTMNGKPLDNFSPERFTYHLRLPRGTKQMPRIEAQAAGADTRVAIEPSGDELPGVVTVSLRDTATGDDRLTYKVYCREDRSAGKGMGEYAEMDGVRVAASTHDGNVPANTLDRDLTTRWSAEGVPQEIQYDLGKVKTLDNIALAWFLGDKRFARFEIHLSEDGKAWQKVFDGESSGTTKQLEAYDLDGRRARYVRIVCKGNSQSQWNSIAEVAFGLE